MILLDTHVVVWLAFEADRLSFRAKAAIAEARREGSGIAISDVTLLEVAAIWRKTRFVLNMELATFLEEIEARFAVFPITARACARLTAALPPNYPRDPADRIIGVTALVHGVPLITADRKIRDARVISTIW